MSRYSSYLEKVARNREQFRRSQQAYDNQCPPCLEDEEFLGENHYDDEPDYSDAYDKIHNTEEI